MDGDLQHPPEIISRLLSEGIARDLDIVVASRYSGSGDGGGLASPFRRLVSSSVTLTARALFPRLLGSVHDPMSGFFAVRPGVVDPAVLHPRGFKILLEILVRSEAGRVSEVPFSFARRFNGRSKASGREALRLFRELAMLRTAATRSSLAKFIKMMRHRK